MGFNRGSRGSNRSFGSDRGSRGRGGFGRGRGGSDRGGRGFGGNRSFGSQNSGNRSFGSDRSSGNEVGERKSFGGNRGSFRGNNRGGDRGFRGNNREGGGFFKRGNDSKRGFQNGKGSNSFQEDRKRKMDSDSDMDSDGDEITEKPKSILKTPRLDLKSDKKNVTIKDSSLKNSFQAKTPATPHPIKGGKPSISTPRVPTKEVDFNDSDDDLDEEMTGIEGAMDFEDTSAEDLESFEDMDDLSDLEETEDLEHLGGADSLSEIEDESGDEIGEKKAVPEKSDAVKPVAEKASKVDKSAAKAVQEVGSKGSKDSKQVENNRKLELYKTALYVAKPDTVALERKSFSTCHPYLISIWKTVNEGILLIFDSNKSRDKAHQYFQTVQDLELKKFAFQKAETVKQLLEDTTNDINHSALHFSHIPQGVAKKHWKILFPDADDIDFSVCTDAVITYKSPQEAQKVLQGLNDFRLFGQPVLVKFHRASAKNSTALAPGKKAKKPNKAAEKSDDSTKKVSKSNNRDSVDE